MTVATQRIVMPAPRTVGAPYFNGNNVTEFLETMEYLFEDAVIVDGRQRVMRMARYCEDSIAGYIKGLDYYRDGEWEKMKGVLRSQFKRHDDVQIRQTTNFLIQLRDRKQDKNDDLGSYCRQFSAVSGLLVKEGELSKKDEVEWFIRGLPTHLRRKAYKAAKKEGEKLPDFERVKSFVMKEYEVDEEMRAMEDPADATHLIEQVREPKVGSKDLFRPPTLVVKEGIVAAVPDAASVPVITATTDGNELVEKMSKLSINTIMALEKMTAAMERQGPGQRRMSYPPRAGYLDPAKSRSGAPLPADLSDKDARETWTEYFRRTNRCNFCEAVGHIGSNCPTAMRLMDEGKICRNMEGRYCPGQPEHRNPPFSVYGVQGGLIRKVQEMLRESVKESELTQNVRIASIYLDEVDTEEEYEDGPAMYGVAASQATSGRSRTISGRVDKERDMPTMRSQRRGSYVRRDSTPISDTQPFETQPTQLLSHNSSETIPMEDVRPLNATEGRATAAPVKRTRFTLPDGPQKLERVIRGTPRSGKLASLVLQAPVGGSNDLTVEDVLAGSAETRQLIFNKKQWEQGDEGRAILMGQATAPPRHTAASVSAVSARYLRAHPPPVSSEPTPTFNAELAGQQVLALYDTGSNVNVVGRNLAESFNLKIDPVPEVRVTGYTGQTTPIGGVIRNVMIGIEGEPMDSRTDGRIRVSSNVFVAGNLDPRYDIILGQPFRKETRSAIVHDGDRGEAMHFIDPITGGEVVIRPLDDSDGLNDDAD